MQHLVSIITPSYNCESFISDTITSVISQTYDNWEMIIVDDCSTDNSLDIIQSFMDTDARIHLILNGENAGAAVCRNLAIKKAKGRYIAFLDSDDLWVNNKLEKQINYMVKNNVSLSYTSCELIDEMGIKLNKIISPIDKLDYNELLRENQIACLTAIYDAQLIGKYYMPLIRKRQDYGLWLSILKETPYAYKAPGIMALYRVRSDSISSNKVELIRYNFRLFNEHEGLSKLKSLQCVLWNIYRKFKKQWKQI